MSPILATPYLNMRIFLVWFKGIILWYPGVSRYWSARNPVLHWFAQEYPKFPLLWRENLSPVDWQLYHANLPLPPTPWWGCITCKLPEGVDEIVKEYLNQRNHIGMLNWT